MTGIDVIVLIKYKIKQGSLTPTLINNKQEVASSEVIKCMTSKIISHIVLTFLFSKFLLLALPGP